MKLPLRVAIVLHIALIFYAIDINNADGGEHGRNEDDHECTHNEYEEFIDDSAGEEDDSVSVEVDSEDDGGYYSEGKEPYEEDDDEDSGWYGNSTSSRRYGRLLPAVGEATIGQFPYFTSLIINQNDGSTVRCAGALISDVWVLTAASCVASATYIKVYAGWSDIRHKSEKAQLNVYTGWSSVPTMPLSSSRVARAVRRRSQSKRPADDEDGDEEQDVTVTRFKTETITKFDTKTKYRTRTETQTDTKFIIQTETKTLTTTETKLVEPTTQTEAMSEKEQETPLFRRRNDNEAAMINIVPVTKTRARTATVTTSGTKATSGTKSCFKTKTTVVPRVTATKTQKETTKTVTVRVPTTIICTVTQLVPGTSPWDYDQEDYQNTRETITVTKTVRVPVATATEPGTPPLPRGTPSSFGTALIHPGYRKNALHNNIALVRLHAPFILSGAISPIRLHKKDGRRQNIDGMSLTSMGFAQDDSNLLYFTKLEQIGKSNCHSRIAEIYLEYPEHTACLSSTSSDEGFCHGGVGGPVVHTFQKEQDASLLGIISQHEPCPSAYPLAYTKIGPYLDWIKSHVKHLYYQNN